MDSDVSDASRYQMDTRAILEIKNVTAADHRTEYRCDVRVWDVETNHVMLLYSAEEQQKEQEGKMVTVLFCSSYSPNYSYFQDFL